VERQQQVFERDNLVFLVAPDETVKRISGNQDRFYAPKLSPDQSKIVYVGRETGLYISTIDGLRTFSVGEGENPAWMPDSSGIVYDVPVSDGAKVIDGDIWFASASGTERTNLTKTPGVVELEPDVAPDGEHIAFASNGTIYTGRLVQNTPKK
jgi:Tol biopolymer transport system component